MMFPFVVCFFDVQRLNSPVFPIQAPLPGRIGEQDRADPVPCLPFLGRVVELDFREAIDFERADGAERDQFGVNADDNPSCFEGQDRFHDPSLC